MSSAADGSGEGKCGDQCKDSRRGLVMQVGPGCDCAVPLHDRVQHRRQPGVHGRVHRADDGRPGCPAAHPLADLLGGLRLRHRQHAGLSGVQLRQPAAGHHPPRAAVRTGPGRRLAAAGSGRRFLDHVAVGIVFGPTITYIGEISSVNIRGVLALFFNLMLSFGMLITFLCGWKLGWRHTCLVVGIGPVVVMFLVSLMLPRSAKWLISKGHPVEEAQRSLRFYHGKDYDVDQQIQKIRESLGEEHRHDASLFEVLQLLRHRHYLVPFCLMLCMYVLFVFSGGFTTASFAPVVFKDVGGFSNPYIGSILVGALRVITSIMMSYIVQKSERRTSLMINGVVGGAACLVSGFFFHYSAALADYAWVQLVSVLVIVSAMSLGIAPLTNLLLTELLPNAIRAEAGGILLTFFGTINFIMVYTFPLAVAAVDMSGVYWFFTVMHFLLFVFAKVCLPHTRGKSIEEVQKMFVKNVTNCASDPIHVHLKDKRGSLTYQTFPIHDSDSAKQSGSP
ncbi:facilitated trehalose transporter Tret1-like [Amphibalanus amphitrite]|uniref:facilitated trehalose transporter Tret1-like n=1 Tax=Amphibalanus amphitrite TaxID=1232801 RepID=UPI001C905A21|nr:facilitated trehalose transporter Tret1-like [Amphibalanus amphitrite]